VKSLTEISLKTVYLQEVPSGIEKYKFSMLE